jgi:hypothetical protein
VLNNFKAIGSGQVKTRGPKAKAGNLAACQSLFNVQRRFVPFTMGDV